MMTAPVFLHRSDAYTNMNYVSDVYHLIKNVFSILTAFDIVYEKFVEINHTP